MALGIGPAASPARAAAPGAYAAAPAADKDVRAAAEFAVKAQRKVLQGKKEPGGSKLKLVEILGAEQQVVAGLNYRLQLKVNLNGQEKAAEATVWWQSWRKPEPYELTSWVWK